MLKRNVVVKQTIIPQCKIYISNYNPKNILKKIHILEPHFVSNIVKKDIVSAAGFFELDEKNNKITKLKQCDKPVVKKRFSDIELLLDFSYYKKLGEQFQIPCEHNLLVYHEFKYCINNETNKLYLVVEGVYSEPPTTNKYAFFCPTNIYFFLRDDFDNILIEKELNEYLSLLI